MRPQVYLQTTFRANAGTGKDGIGNTADARSVRKGRAKIGVHVKTAETGACK